jgi:leucyl aminopeptidase (aminopeptidase T)
MPDSAVALARAILSRNLGVKKGNAVLIESWPHSLQYVRAFVDESRRLGAQPTVLYEDDNAWWDSVAARRYGPFQRLSPAEKAAVANADAYIYFWGPADMRKSIDLGGAIGGKVTGFNEEWYVTARKCGLRGYRMSLGLASDITARRFGLDGPRWRDRLVRAGAADAHRMMALGGRIAKKLARGKELRIRHSNGTDLRIGLRGAPPVLSGGIPVGATRRRPRAMLEGNPSGQVHFATEKSNASGTFVSNRTVYDMARYERLAGSRWKFDGGRLTARSMGLGRRSFEAAFARAPRGRDQLSFISIGLNPLARELPPCEDTEEGAILLGIGNNGVAGGRVRMPFNGFAMIGGATLTVDGEPIARGGRIL